VVSRDLLIVGGVVLAWLMDAPMDMKPLWISKVNTTVQIIFAGAFLFFRGNGWDTATLVFFGAPLVAAFTVASALRMQIMFWLGVLGVLVLGMWLLGDVMTPFIAGMALAYFLDPVADKLEEWGLPRLAATTLILAMAVVLFLAIFLLFAPLLAQQVGQFMDRLPDYVATLVRLFNENAPQWLKDALERTSINNGGSAPELAAKAAGWLAAVLKSVWTGSMALFNLLSLLVVTPIVLFYMLNDWDRMVAVVDGWLPRHHADTIRGIARDIDRAMAGFIRGQGTVCLVLGAFYAVALVASGLHFGLLIGITAGLLSFIPYVGSIIGGTLSIGMALVQFWPDWVQILLIV